MCIETFKICFVVLFCVHVGRVAVNGNTKVTKTVKNGSNVRNVVIKVTGRLPGGWNPFKPVKPNNGWNPFKPVKPNNRRYPHKPSGNSGPGSPRGSGGSPSSSSSVNPSEIVNKHNNLRRSVSPPASNMLKMVNAEFHDFITKCAWLNSMNMDHFV